jgi:hypothetical protein
MPIGIASICNAAARPYRVGSADPISVIQWTRAAAKKKAGRGTGFLTSALAPSV